jgi:uncharacterized phiE125 gp8 family phage protein
MTYKVITPVSTEPVSLAEARLHLRIDDDNTADDDLISALIVAAREMAEHHTRCALAPQTLEMALDHFPGFPGWHLHHRRHLPLPPEDSSFELAMPPVASVASIKYTDPQGTEQTLDPSKYAVSPYGNGAKIYPTYGNVWPLTQHIPDAVRVRYDTGYGRDGGPVVPRAAKSAILLLVGHLYENRQEVVTDTRAVAVQMPIGAAALLDTLKVWVRVQ